ncbi:MAG: MbnP family protein [Bacteroidota bacterium]
MKSLSLKSLPLIGLCALLLFAACGEKDTTETGNLALNFQLQYDGQPLVMFDRYEYPNGMEFFFTRFNFYLSNLTINQTGGTSSTASISLNEVDFLNLTSDHESAAGAAEGTTVVFENVALGLYDNLQFDIGVPAELNGKRPREYPNDHPLADTGEYWDSWNSFIFSKTEGKIDTDGDGQAELGLAYHIGGDETLRNLVLDKSFSIENGQTTTVTIIIEMKRMFDDGTTVYDPLQTAQIHSLTQLGEANILADNLKAAFR